MGRRAEAPTVGIFFLAFGHLYAFRSGLEAAEERCGFLDVALGHADFFEFLRRRRREFAEEDDYSRFPRGRVLYFLPDQAFVVYAARRILRDPKMKREVEALFRIEGKKVYWRWDEHYQ